MCKKIIHILPTVLCLLTLTCLLAFAEDTATSEYEYVPDENVCFAFGDVDNDEAITASDARLTLRAAVQFETLSEEQLSAADITKDGTIDAADARKILRIAVNLDKTTGHKRLKTVDVKAATCSETGISADLCKYCGKLFNPGKINKTEHIGIEWETVEPATCKNRGLAQQKCILCNEVISTRKLDKTEHSFGEKQYETAPNCFWYVNYYQECSVCGFKDVVKTEAPVNAHNWGWKITVAATCTTDGLKEKICLHCGEKSGDSEVIKAPGHTPERGWTMTKAVSCTEDGCREKTCTVCGEICAQEKLNATGHAIRENTYRVLVPVSCTKDGQVEFYCTNCLTTVTETVAATNHSKPAQTEIKNPTCTLDGSETYVCLTCRETVTETIPATGHTPEAWNEAEFVSDGNDGGYHSRKCKICREELQRRYID